MPRSHRILAFVLAGGEGERMWPLTANLPKPALHVACGYRIVDFVLSNLLNSGVCNAYVLAQYKPRALVAHVEEAWSGRFRRAGGFIRTLVPCGGRQGCFRGTADAVRRQLHLVREHVPDLVAVFAADQVYRMDLRRMADFHRACGAAMSVAATRVPLADASCFGVIGQDTQDRVVAFVEKPEHPAAMRGDPDHVYASMGNYLFEPEALTSMLDRCHLVGGTDFGHHVMPMAARYARTYAYDFSTQQIPGLQPWEKPTYWRDIGSVESLQAAQHDLTGQTPCIELANTAWPMHKERRRDRREPTELDADRAMRAGVQDRTAELSL